MVRSRAGSFRAAPAVAGAVLALVLLGPDEARATNGFTLLTQSSKSAGRGGAEIAIGDDPLTSTVNPATIVESGEFRFGGNLHLLFERVRTTDQFRDDIDQILQTPFPSLGFTWDPWAVRPEGEGGPAVPSRARLGFTLWMPVTLVVSPTFTFAGRVTDTLAVGASVHPLATYLNIDLRARGGSGPADPSAEPDFIPNGIVRIHRRPDGTREDPPEPFLVNGEQVSWGEIFTLANGTAVDANTPPPEILIRLEKIQGYGLAGSLGFLWTPRHDLAIGLGYRTPGVIWDPRGEGSIDLDKAVTAIEANPDVGDLLGAAFAIYLPDGGANGYEARYDVEGTSLHFPQQVGLGFAWTPIERLLLALDLKWINWERASSKIVIKAQKGSNDDFNEINGGPTLDYTVKLAWKDSWVVAVGGAYALDEEWILRAGYNYARNPVSKDFLIGNSLATEHHVALGAGWLYSERWEFDFAYLYGLPTQVRDDRARVRSTSEQHIAVLGFSYRY